MLVHGHIQHGNRARGKSRALVFFCALFFLRFHILWKHTGFIWNSSCEGVQLDAIFLPVQKKMCQATTILLPEYAMHIANIVCTWLHGIHTSRLHGRGRESANLFRGYVQPRGYAHWYIDGSVIHSGQFADIVRQKRCQPYHVILGGSKGLTCYSYSSGKDHFSSLLCNLM